MDRAGGRYSVSGNHAAVSGQTGTPRPGEFLIGGEPGAPIKIEVFSDYQCPACRTFYLDTIKPILANYARAQAGPNGQPIKPRVCVVYRDFPLDMHQFARPAARLSLAAQRLGRERWLRVSEALYTYQDAVVAGRQISMRPLRKCWIRPRWCGCGSWRRIRRSTQRSSQELMLGAKPGNHFNAHLLHHHRSRTAATGQRSGPVRGDEGLPRPAAQIAFRICPTRPGIRNICGRAAAPDEGILPGLSRRH